MSGRDIVVIGASAGGVEALRTLIPRLPADLPAAVFVVLHIPPTAPAVLPRLIAKHSAMQVGHATDGALIEHGRVYMAPPDRHLLVKRKHVSLVHGPRENGVRPAIDPLFRTAARAHGARVVAVLLSGTLDDGVAALEIVRRRGGVVAAQDPEEALFGSLPKNAIDRDLVDHVCTLDELATLIERLACEPLPATAESLMSGTENDEQDPLELATRVPGSEPRGELTPHTCPECQGSMWVQQVEGYARFQCRVGHAYSEEFMVTEKSAAVEAAMWTALTAIEEHIALTRRMEERAREAGSAIRAELYGSRAADLDRQAHVLRDVLIGSSTTPTLTDSAHS